LQSGPEICHGVHVPCKKVNPDTASSSCCEQPSVKMFIALKTQRAASRFYRNSKLSCLESMTKGCWM
jgi:hypothetical protein